MQLEVESGTGQVEPSEQDLRYGMFTQLDKRAREIEQQFKSTWSELADLCLTMRDSSYWREGGYNSFNSWLVSALPCSRSWAYLAIGVREELKDLEGEDLKQIPLANADVLRRLPKQERMAQETIQAAKDLTPAEFLPKIVRESKEAALELKIKLRYTVTTSQESILRVFLKSWRLLNPEDENAPDIDVIIDGVMEDWLLTNQAEIEAKA